MAGDTPVYNFRSEKLWHVVVSHRNANGKKRSANCFRFDDLTKKLGLQIWISTGTDETVNADETR